MRIILLCIFVSHSLSSSSHYSSYISSTILFIYFLCLFYFCYFISFFIIYLCYIMNIPMPVVVWSSSWEWCEGVSSSLWPLLRTRRHCCLLFFLFLLLLLYLLILILLILFYWLLLLLGVSEDEQAKVGYSLTWAQEGRIYCRTQKKTCFFSLSFLCYLFILFIYFILFICINLFYLCICVSLRYLSSQHHRIKGCATEGAFCASQTPSLQTHSHLS